MIANSENVTHQICQFLKIPFENSLLEPTENGVPAMSNSMFKDSRVHGKILNQSNKKRFQYYLQQSTMKDLLSILEREAKDFGYQWNNLDYNPNKLTNFIRQFKVLFNVSITKGKRLFY